MRMRHVVAVSSAILVSFGAIAGGQQHSSAGASAEAATIREAQQKLMAQGFETGVDGRLGPQTQQGLIAFQESRGLEPSGQLDPQTIAALGVDSNSSAGSGASSPGAAQSGPEGAAEPARGGGGG